MNYLAHLYLSGKSKDVMVGNFIADVIKGRQIEQYSGEVLYGIRLHRVIDQFIDTHPIAAKSRARFYPVYHHYSGVVNDMVYDHLLAQNWHHYSDEPLWKYSIYCYAVLLSRWFSLPVAVRSFLPNVVLNRRLTEYAKISGLMDSLKVMSRSTSLPDHSEKLEEILLSHYDEFKSEFHAFFGEMIAEVERFKASYQEASQGL